MLMRGKYIVLFDERTLQQRHLLPTLTAACWTVQPAALQARQWSQIAAS